LTLQIIAPGVQYQGYVILSLEFVPWGDAAFMGLYFFGVSIEISNATQAVTLLSVTQALNGGGLTVVIDPTATLTHCVSVPCVDENPVYFSRVGQSEIYMIAVDASGQSGTATVESVVFEDMNHVAIAFSSITPLDTSGLNVTFGFVVPAAALDVAFLRVTVQISFNVGMSSQFQTEFAVLSTQQTFVAQTRFEVVSAQNASSATFLPAWALLFAAVLALMAL